MAVNQLDIEVGERINKIVAKSELSSRQFAISIGMDPSQFAKILKGTAAISLEKLVEISSKYKASLQWLATGSEDEKFLLNEEQAPYGSKNNSNEIVQLLTTAMQIVSSQQQTIQTHANTINNQQGTIHELAVGRKTRASA